MFFQKIFQQRKPFAVRQRPRGAQFVVGMLPRLEPVHETALGGVGHDHAVVGRGVDVALHGVDFQVEGVFQPRQRVVGMPRLGRTAAMRHDDAPQRVGRGGVLLLRRRRRRGRHVEIARLLRTGGRHRSRANQ